MKAITLYQPYPMLIRDRLKPVETRSWPTRYRGDLAIHAGLEIDEDACKKFGIEQSTLEIGVIVCVVRLVDCVRLPNPKVIPDSYGDYTDGRYGWILDMVRPLKTPVRVKGRQGLWNYEGLDSTRQTRLFG